MHNDNNFCPYCLTATKANLKCGECGRDTIRVSSRIRFPAKRASKMRWREFFKSEMTWIQVPITRRLKKLGCR